MAMNKVKVNSDVELKDRLVAIPRVAAPLHSQLLLLSATATVSLAGVLVRQAKLPPLSPKVLRLPRRTL